MDFNSLITFKRVYNKKRNGNFGGRCFGFTFLKMVLTDIIPTILNLLLNNKPAFL